MKTAISIPTPIFLAAERAARKLGMSRSQFFAQAAQRFLESMQEDQVTASYNAAFEAPETPAESLARRRATRRVLASVEWNNE